mgnify:CR=1 FL=1
MSSDKPSKRSENDFNTMFRNCTELLSKNFIIEFQPVHVSEVQAWVGFSGINDEPEPGRDQILPLQIT